MNQEKIESITINNIEYVRKDSIAIKDTNEDGLDYVIVRSRDQGVMSGYLVGYEGCTVKLNNARQLWRYDSRFVLPDLAEFGPRDASKCRFSAESTAGHTIIFNACGIIPCTVDGGNGIRGVKAESK